MNPEYLVCLWDRGTWSDAHGDGKATTLGAYTMRTMMTTTQPSEYRVKVLYMRKVALLNFAMPGISRKDGPTKPPTSKEVIAALAIELKKTGI